MGEGSTWPYQPTIWREGDLREEHAHYAFTSADRENTAQTRGEAHRHRSYLRRDCFPRAVTMTEKQQSCTPGTDPTGCVQHPAWCSLDILCGPLDSAGQRSPLVRSGMKVIKGDICHVAVDLFQLLQDDAALLLDLRVLQRTVLHDVSQELYNCNTFPTLAIPLPEGHPVLLQGEKTQRQLGQHKRSEQQTTLGRGCNITETSLAHSHCIGEGQTPQF